MEDQVRKYQVVVLRLNPLDPKGTVAITEEVFRASAGKKTGKGLSGKRHHDQLEASLCSFCHFVLGEELEKEKPSEDSHYYFSSVSTGVAVRPHSDLGIVLYEIPEARLTFQESCP
jgi:hypothetical protein